MKKELNLPFLENGAHTINEYLEYVRTAPDNRSPRNESHEQAIINVLTGLGGLIEYNVRAGYQHFSRKNNLPQETFHNFGQLVDSLNTHIEKAEHRKLLKISSQIRNKLIHADFSALYKKTKEAYEISGVSYQQSSFEPVAHLIKTTLTRYGCNLDIATATATDSRGVSIPTTRLLPGEGDAITVDFSYFYHSGHFIHVYDVLYTCYESIIFFRYDHA
jgi:hypothetical protein